MAEGYFAKKEYIASIYYYQQALEKVTPPRLTSGWAGKLHYQLALVFSHLYSTLIDGTAYPTTTNPSQKNKIAMAIAITIPIIITNKLSRKRILHTDCPY